MKNILKSLLPHLIYLRIRSLIRYLRTLKCFIYDTNLYYKYSVNISELDKSKALSHIIMKTHVIEKGLTMPKMKIGFGQKRIIDLIDILDAFITQYGSNYTRVNYSIGVLEEYLSVHSNQKENLSALLISKIEKLVEKIGEVETIIQSKFQKEDYFYECKDFINFANSRRSIRNFTGEKVDSTQVINAINMCRNTPSACNRQSVKIHMYENYSSVQAILNIQGGNRGFGHLVSCVVVITYDMSVYFEGIERNAGLVDGGLYSMNLLYFLHYQKLGACILNTSNDKSKDQSMRKATSIPNNEAFVSMIAIGEAQSEFYVALSKRDPLSAVLKVH